MAMTFAPMPELEKIVKLLQEKFPDELEHVKPDHILYGNFSKKESEVKGKIGPVPKRFASYFPDKEYWLEVHKESWDAFKESERLYVILHELTHIPEDGFNNSSKEYKKTVKHTVQDFATLLSQFGINGEKLDLLEKKVKK